MKSADNKDSLYGSGVIVTPKSIYILGQEYSVKKIVSCKIGCTVEVNKSMAALSKVCVALSLGCGATFLAWHPAAFGIAAAVLGGIALFPFSKSRVQVYHVCLRLSSDIIEAYSTEKREDARDIVDAINKVLISRSTTPHSSFRPFPQSQKSSLSDDSIPLP